MVTRTQIPPRPLSTESSKLWNPSKTLGIINPDRDSLTCVGYAPSQGRRCRNPIRADNRALIMSTLDEIAYMSPDSLAVMSRLRAIAESALCIRYHQDQAEAVVMEWQRKIKLLKPLIREREPVKPAQSSRLQEPARERRLEDLEDQLKAMMEAMAKLREEVDSQRHQIQECDGSEERAVKDRRETEKERRERSEEMKRKESERLERERLERERLEKERIEKERVEKERVEKERLARKRREEAEEKERREREAAANNERIRQRAQKLREDREREKREREQKEREEWDRLWAKYQERWVQFQASVSDTREGDIRDAIPWPVESGSYRDAKHSNVKEFFQKALSRDKGMVKAMRKECLKWHPDRMHTWLRGAQLSDVDKMMVDMICRVVTELLNESAGRSSEFLG